MQSFYSSLKTRLLTYYYSNACADWNSLCNYVDKNTVIAGYEFDNGQYYFDFGF